MVLLAFVALVLGLWLVWTKMAKSPPLGLKKLKLEQPVPEQLTTPEVQQLPSSGFLPQFPGNETEAISSEPSQAPASPSRQPPPCTQLSTDPSCQLKPPIPRSSSDCVLSLAADSARPLSRFVRVSSTQLLKQMHSLSFEEQAASPAQRKQQAMAKFVLGSFEDNSSDEELVAGGAFPRGRRRRNSLAHPGSSSYVDSEASLVMR